MNQTKKRGFSVSSQKFKYSQLNFQFCPNFVSHPIFKLPSVSCLVFLFQLSHDQQPNQIFYNLLMTLTATVMDAVLPLKNLLSLLISSLFSLKDCEPLLISSYSAKSSTGIFCILHFSPFTIFPGLYCSSAAAAALCLVFVWSQLPTASDQRWFLFI